MGQKGIENEKQNKKEKEEENEKENSGGEKDSHMIEILKKENLILKKQLESLNNGKKDQKENYNTLLSMLEVLQMQRTKIMSITKGNIYYIIIYRYN